MIVSLISMCLSGSWLFNERKGLKYADTLSVSQTVDAQDLATSRQVWLSVAESGLLNRCHLKAFDFSEEWKQLNRQLMSPGM